MSRVIWDRAIQKAMGYRQIKLQKAKVYPVKFLHSRVAATCWPFMEVVKVVHHRNGRVSLYLVDAASAEAHYADECDLRVQGFHVKAGTHVHVFDLKTYRDTGFYTVD